MIARPGVLVLACAAALIAAGPAAAAEDQGAGAAGARGYLTTFACAPLPRPTRVEVEISDNTEENLRLQALFVQRLERRGVIVAPHAPLVLSLDIATVVEGTRRKAGDLVDVRVGEDENSIGQEGFARFHMNIWSTARDSVLGGRRRTVEEQGTDQIRITADLNSRADGRCLWRGEIVQDLAGTDPRYAAERMIPLLVDALGKSAEHTPIEID